MWRLYEKGLCKSKSVHHKNNQLWETGIAASDKEPRNTNICQQEFDEEFNEEQNYCKVWDHCYYTGDHS